MFVKILKKQTENIRKKQRKHTTSAGFVNCLGKIQMSNIYELQIMFIIFVENLKKL